MSHFNVMVVTDDLPTTEVLDAALQPFHEYECTGTLDEYVQLVDHTEDADDNFRQNGDEGQSFTDFIRGWYNDDWPVYTHPHPEPEPEDTPWGYSLLDSAGDHFATFRRTNPDRKWDWWVIGGRWRGQLRVVNGAQAWKGRLGVHALVSGKDTSDPRSYDQARVGDLDLEAMRQARIDARNKSFDEFMARKAKESDDPGLTRERMIDLADEYGTLLRQIRKEWGSYESSGLPFHEFVDQHPRGQEFRGHPASGIDWGVGWEPEGEESIQEFLADVANPLSTFAVLWDGVWYEQGSMGWWGMVSDDKKDAWTTEFTKLLAGLGEDQYITIIDCHF